MKRLGNLKFICMRWLLVVWSYIKQTVLIKPHIKCHGWEGPCKRVDAVKYRMNTRYVEDEKNYQILCPDCQKACDIHWADMWSDYYSDCF
jgi:hypothetical protein